VTNQPESPAVPLSPVEDWLTFRDVADVLDVSPNKVRQMVREHELASSRPPGVREPVVPAAFLLDGDVVRGLSGTLMLLVDHGFDDDEAIDWLFSPDDSLPGRPIDALRENRGTEVRRRAQAVD
jgi:hypothetical protein